MCLLIMFCTNGHSLWLSDLIEGESLEVASGTVITRWFRRRTLAMAIGINLSLARIASAAQKLASPWIVRNYELPYATWFGSSLCILSFVCALALKWTDRQYNREATEVNADDNDEIPQRQQPSKPNTLARNVGGAKALENSTGRTIRIVEQKPQTVDRRPSTSSLSDDLLESFQSTKRWFSTSLNGNWENDRSMWKKVQAFLRKFMLPKKFWLLNFATVALYTSVYPFYIIFSDFLQTRFYPGDPQAAATVMTIPDLCTAIGPPIFGLFIDKVGHRGKFIPLAGLLVCTVHALFHFTTVSPVITSLLLGFSHVMFYTCTWVCVPDVVKPSQLGIGYGIVAASVDLSITVCPLLVAFIRSISPDFTNVGILLLSMSGLSVILSTILVIMDIRHGQSMQLKRLPTRKVRTLNRPSNATDKNSAVKTTKSESKDTKPDSDSTECEIKDPQCDVENATSEVKNSNSEVASSNWEVKDVQWQESKLL
ncbi:major facilitator superfamily domain-containing protein [Paraphysoderma sedebokerense]|nr:major facilitator superfamily domain-containing protein [Paraphysoderma sedebokerense]